MADIKHPDYPLLYPTDRLALGRIITDSNHSQIHAGNGFSFSAKGALAQGDIDTYTFTVPSDTYIHFQALTIDSDGGNDLTVQLFDQTILAASPGGTLITPSNRHRAGAGLRAVGTLTLAANPSNNDTMTINDRTYTFKDPWVDAANNIDIGANAAATVTNIVAAINAGAGAGTAYGTGTAVHANVFAFDGTGDSVGFVAKTPGAAANSYATTETFTNAGNVFGAATLTGGTGPSARRASWDSTVTVRLDPTIQYIGYADFDDLYMFKQGAVSSKTQATSADSIEWVILPGATFSVRFTNSGAGVGTVNYSFRPFWYEEGGV